MLKHALIVGLIVGVVCLSAAPAWSTIGNLKSYKAAYPGKEPQAYSCKVCHNSAVGKKGDLNAYGLALQQHKAAAGAKQLTEEDYRAIEPEDADGDKASNLDEINAGTAPGDPASTPAPKGNESSRLAPTTEVLQAWLAQMLTPMAEAAADEQPVPAKAPSAAANTEPSAAAPATAEYVGMDTCAGCHPKQYEEFKHSTHSRITIPGEADKVGVQGCETCHGPGSLHAEAGGGRGVGGIINPRKDPSVCFSCHLDKKAEFRLPYHHPLIEGKMNCTDCHNPHGDDVRPWSATSLKDVNEACFKCHKDQRGPFVWEHEALREGCTTCHKVHGSINDKMLLVRDNNLCLRCHTQVNFPTIGRSSHAGRLPGGTCFSAGCHTAIHGSNFDDHLRY